MQLQQHGKSLANLWSLMDTPYEDRQPFLHVANISLMTLAEISTPGSLTPDIVEQVCAHASETHISFGFTK